VPVWPMLRVRWFFAEWNRLYAAVARPVGGAQAHLRSMLAGARSAAAARHDDPAGEDRGPARRDLVLLSDGQSFARLEGRWLERFCDPVIAAAAQRNLTTALWTPLHLYHHPRATRSTWLQAAIDRANLLGGVRARAAKPPMHLPALEELSRSLEAQGLSSSAVSLPRIASDGARLQAVARLFGRRLAKTRPRIALLDNFYNLEGMAFVLACRRLGIPVVDLQHGVQSRHHPAYAAWSAPIGGHCHALLPDRFWVWSDWEAEVIREWCAGTGHAPFVGGNPWLDVWRSDSAWPGVDVALRAAEELRDRHRDRRIVLVTLQFGLDAAEQLEPLIRVLRAASDRLAFWIRLHPAMLERREEVRASLATSNRPHELDICSDLPLHALLSRTDVHLTHSSSTVIEAAQFGIPSVLTSSYGAEVFGPQVESGRAVVELGDAARVAETLLKLASRRVRSGPLDAPDVGTSLDALLADTAAGAAT
jgi:glycosyltransferase involved in cell wall biosynthesis